MVTTTTAMTTMTAMAKTSSAKRLTVLQGTQMSIITNPDIASLKRVAWAYGCSKKGSDEEAALLAILLAKAKAS